MVPAVNRAIPNGKNRQLGFGAPSLFITACGFYPSEAKAGLA